MASLAADAVTVRIPGALLLRTGNRRSLKVAARTVREVIEALDRDYPGLQFNLCYETGELRSFVNVFLEDENVRYLQGLDTPVEPGDTVHIFHSIAGG
jgi:molybdopterin synthase sulfur carrier subunit